MDSWLPLVAQRLDLPHLDATALSTRDCQHLSQVNPCAGAALILTMSGARVVNTIEDALVEGDDFTPYWNGASAVAAGLSPYGWLAENPSSGSV